MNISIRWIGVCLSVFALNSFAQYSGRVFVDENRNGKYDGGEMKLARVAVSDGLNVVLTDKDGKYVLPGHEKEKFLFITTPSGYQTNNAYYHRIDEGRQVYDFGVYHLPGKIDGKGRHKFIQISDTEIGGKQGHDKWLNNLREYASNENVAFIVHTGDICYEAGLKCHFQLMNTENMNVPVFYGIGNHDLVKGKSGEELFERIYGPVFYSFDVGEVHYVMLPMLYGDFEPSYSKKDVYLWLKNDLKCVAQGKPVMIFCHELFLEGDSLCLGSGQEESVDLEKANVRAWVYGHWHVNHIQTHKTMRSVCTSTLACGGIDHASAAFRVFTVDGRGDFSTELRYTYLDKSFQLASLNGELAPVQDGGFLPLVANVYHTVSPVLEVECTVWCEGKQMGVYQLNPQTVFTWSRIVKLPDVCDGKLVTVKSTVRFANGEVAKTERIVRYKTIVSEVNAKDDWTNMRGDASHVGYSSASVVPPLKLAWVQNVGSNIYMASPLVHEGRVFVATADEDFQGKASVQALDAATGKIVWKCPVKASVRNSIAFTEGKVFAQDVWANLYAIDAETGKICWWKKLEWNMIPPLNGGLVASDGIVYAGSGKSLCAVDANTGNVLWKNDAWEVREGCTVTLSVNKDVVVGGSHWKAIYVNDVHTGKLLWENEKFGLRNRSSSPVLKDDVLYVISLNSFFKIHAKTGEILVQKELGYNVDVTSSPLVTDDVIVLGTAEKGVVALDAKTLVEKWHFKTGTSLVYSAPYTSFPSCTVETSPVMSGDVVYITASDGCVYALSLTSGKLQWKYVVGAPCFASPALSGNTLFVADFGGNVYGFIND